MLIRLQSVRGIRVCGFLLVVVMGCAGLESGRAQTNTRALTNGFHPKPVPSMQAIPLPHDQVSIQHEGKEQIRFHFGNDVRRPFIYPVNGPSGRSLTRMGHPHDPVTHSHHNSVWISHHQVNGVDFWGDHGGGKGIIQHQRVESLEDTDTHAAVVSSSLWKDAEGKALLKESRRLAVEPREAGQYVMIIDVKLEAAALEVVLGKTPFGIIGVRMAKSIGVHDGGGRIMNSDGLVDEKGVFWKPAKWVDYSGQIANGVVEGISLMDHPGNPNHPAVFHVRNDGWMGACLTFDGDRVLKEGESVRLRYGLFVHSGLLAPPAIDAEWKRFGGTGLFEFKK